MNATAYIVAPHTHFSRHDELVGALDRLFREYRVPPAIIQYSFVERRPSNHYKEIIYFLTPFPTRPTSELLEDIGHALAPAQARFTTLLSSYHPPVFPPLPAVALYAPPNEEDFIVTRSHLHSAGGCRSRATPDGFLSTFESKLVIYSAESNQIRSTLRASADSHRHSYALHSLSVTARQEPNASAGCTITPHFAPRDPRFERTCNGLRSECTWIWEVLDKQLRANGFSPCANRETPGTAAGSNDREAGVATGEFGNATNGDTKHPIAHLSCHQHPVSVAAPNGSPTLCSSRPPTENIVINVPISSTTYPLCVTFTATLTSTAGLDAIDATHRTSQWADPQALEGLQSAFNRVHPAVQVVHHVVRVEIPDVGGLIRAGLGRGGSSDPSTDAEVERLEGPEIRVYAHRRGGDYHFGELQVHLDRDAGVVGRRGDEDEEDNSDEEEEL
ncbi:hypothetical protein B0J17DRAFT_719705 [Rhizoctonia solani]|nr:hypothetical protein B0J17DRAFT_719705 [Rhizoctonia solani]